MAGVLSNTDGSAIRNDICDDLRCRRKRDSSSPPPVAAVR